jgi:hypothetical protein
MGYKHGYAGTKVWYHWKSMRKRCSYVPGYADKGIRVCERWNSFLNFLEDMGEPPTGLVYLGRIDHSKDYEPGNCQWEVWNITGTGRNTSKHPIQPPGKWIRMQQ